MPTKIELLTLFLSLQSLAVITSAQDTQIKQIYVILGNSPRAPLTVYPSDTYNATYWKTKYGGLGQITPTGLLQAYKLGQYIKNYYNQFLTPSYVKDFLFARSVDQDSSLQSLSTFLAGMYPPANSNQLWSASVSWFPLPVHSNEGKTDRIFSSPCPKYDQMLNNDLNAINNLQNEFDERFFVQKIINQTGYQMLNYYRMREVLDFNMAKLANNLPIEPWVRENLDQMLKASQYALNMDYGTIEKAKFKAGGLLYDIVENIARKSQGSTNEIMIYSVTDDHLSALTKLLKPSDPLTVLPTGTAIIVELRQDRAGNYYFQLMYKSNLVNEPVRFDPVQVEGCNVLCPISNIQQVTAGRIVPDASEYCKLPVATTTTTTQTTPTLAQTDKYVQEKCPETPINMAITSVEIGLIILTVILGLLVISLIFFVVHLKRKNVILKTSF